MIVYNVTVNINDDAHNEWLRWMNDVHIPEVLSYGLFVHARFSKVLIEEESGTTYSIQYTAKSMKDYEQYRDLYAPALQAETLKKFKDKYVAFRTLLEVVQDHHSK